MGKFKLGHIVVTRGIADRLQEDGVFAEFVSKSLFRHRNGDWGDMCDEDKTLNESALKHGGRLFSSYNFEVDGAEKIWIITEWDRSSTTVLFPDEY